MMTQIPAYLLREASEVLAALDEWAHGCARCPLCNVPRGCSHVGRCPLGRVKRLERALEGSDGQGIAARCAIQREMGLIPIDGAAMIPPAASSPSGLVLPFRRERAAPAPGGSR